ERAQRGQAAAGARLGVTERELHAAVENGRQELLLLLLGAALHQRRPARVQGDQREGSVDRPRSLGKDVLLDRGKSASAILFGPAHAEQAGRGQRADAVAYLW